MISTKPLWAHDNRHSFNYLPFSVLFDFLSILYGLFLIFPIQDLDVSYTGTLITGVGFVLLGITHFYYKTKNYIFSETVKYVLTEEEIVFEYGLLNKTKETIPYNSIIKLDVLEEEAGTHTLVIHSNKEIQFRGFDKNFKELRAFPSFDRIPRRDSPQKIIQERIQGNNVEVLASEMHHKLMQKELGFDQSTTTRNWNKGIALLYVFIVGWILVGLFDVHFIDPIFVDDVMERQTYTVNGEGDQLFHTCYTKKGFRYRVYEIQGGKNYPVILYKSRLFGYINHMETPKNGVVTPTVMHGMVVWLFPIFGIYLLFAGLQILKNHGRIKLDDRGILYIGPLATLFIIRICLTLSGL